MMCELKFSLGYRKKWQINKKTGQKSKVNTINFKSYIKREFKSHTVAYADQSLHSVCITLSGDTEQPLELYICSDVIRKNIS